MKHFLHLKGIDSESVKQLIELSIHQKQRLKDKKISPVLTGRSMAMIFQKPSNRTRLSFETGMYQLGGNVLNVQSNEIKMGAREPVSDIAKVMSRYVDLVMIRAKRHDDIETFAENASIPIINGLSDKFHPCQGLADVLTIYEKKGAIEPLKIVYFGDGNNVCHSLISAVYKMGGELTVSCPEAYRPLDDCYDGRYQWEPDPKLAAQGADVLYTDVWTSMGQESETENRQRIFNPYQINQELADLAKPDHIFMHCLPAHRGEEVSADIVDGPNSVVFDQAENRMHAQKAVMVALLNGIPGNLED